MPNVGGRPVGRTRPIGAGSCHMASSLSETSAPVGLAGPRTAFPIAPDDETRRMLCRWHGEYGAVYRVPDTRGGPDHWVVHDPRLVRQVLVQRGADYEKGQGLDRVRLLLGEGIMVSEGAFWARQRRLMQPAFRPRALADFNAMMLAENRALAERWAAAAAGGAAVDVAAHISELTLVIVLKSIFGRDYDALVAAHGNPFALLTEAPERDLRFAARFHRLTGVVAAVVERRRAAPRPAFDFLGHMLAARSRTGASMSTRALIDEVMTLIVAGHETTASVLAWAWYLIATHEDVCARARAEAEAVDEAALGTHGPGADLPFIGRVIDETLRLYPPGWLLSRRARVDTDLGAHRLPPGSQVFISPYVLHRHDAHWRDPERFDPARFARGDEPGHRFAFVPFAAGPRRCAGEHMARTEMGMHLAVMLRRFTPRYAGEAPPAMESRINLRPAAGIYLQLTQR